MRISEAGLALIRRVGTDGSDEYLTQWSDRTKRFSLVGGHVEPGESFRACCIREVEEELELIAGVGFRVAPEPVVPLCKYEALSESAGAETLYRVQLFVTELLTPEAVAKVNANPVNRWLTEPEIRRLATVDRQRVSAQVETVFALAGVIPVKEEYDLFISYAHADDTSDDGDGFVTALVAALQKEHAEFAREPLRVFFDRVAIRTAQDWEERLLHGLKAAKAMLTVLSPSYFRSPWCRREYETFVEHEKGRAWPGDPLSPVYAVEVPGFEGPHADAQKAWLAAQLRGQYCDLKPWRPHGRDAFQVAAVRERMKALWGWVNERVSRVQVVSRSAAHGVPSHNRNFVGREADLANVRKRLAGGAVTAVTAVSGIGGIGKSALAAEYAHLFAEDYPGGRFWLPSEGADDLRDVFRMLEAPLGVTFTDDERKDRDRGYLRIRAELESRPGALVVLDNVSKPALFDPAHLSRYRPNGSRVHVLMTTREEPPTDPEGWLVSVPLDRLSADDGRALLARYRDLGTDDAEWHAAREIVSALGGHALSLEVVGVYLWRHPEIRYQDYREWLREEGLLAAVEGAGAQAGVKLSRHTETVVSRLLKPTLDALSAEELRAVEYAALLPADWMVMPWLRELVGADFPTAVTRAKPWLPDPWARLVGRLKALRLVVPGEDVRLAKMHRVVQAVILGRMTAAEQGARRAKVEALSMARGQHLKTEWWEAEARWEIEPLHQFCQHQLDQNCTQGAELACWIGWPLQALGRLSDARHMLRRSLDIKERSLETMHLELTPYYSSLGLVERELGNLKEAQRLHQRAIEIGETHFKPNDPHFATWYSNLGLVEVDLRNLSEARRLLQQAVEIGELHYKPNDPRLATWYSNLGLVEHHAGDRIRARNLYFKSLAIVAKNLGPNHFKLAVRYSNLSSIEQELGNFVEARKLLRQAVEIYQRHLDPDHPSFALCYLKLSILEKREGNRVEAIRLRRMAYRIWLSKLGSEHPNTKDTREWLVRNDPEFDPNT